jgi:hypothetical protein
MRVNRTRILAAAFVVLLCIGAWLMLSPTSAGASANVSIPASFGPCKGALGDMLIFEDSEGTVRIIRQSGTIYMTIHRRG